MSLFNELKRRNVFKVGVAYVVVAWLVAQVLQMVFESFETPDWVMKTVLVLLATGLPFALENRAFIHTETKFRPPHAR